MGIALYDGRYSKIHFWNALTGKQDLVYVFEIGFQFYTSSTKDNILSEKENLVNNHVFNKNRKHLEFSKSLSSKTSKIQLFDFENISAVTCTSERG